MPNVGAFLLEVHSMRGLACREVARLQDLMEEASARTPEEPSLNISDFRVRNRLCVFFLFLFFSRGFVAFSEAFCLYIARLCRNLFFLCEN